MGNFIKNSKKLFSSAGSLNIINTSTSNILKAKNDFRLSLTSGLSVTTTDVVNAQTIYCTPHNGNVISLYDGTNWVLYESNEFSLALGTLATGKYDVFCYANAGVPTLEFTAWTSDTVPVSTTKLNGVKVKASDNTRRLLGSFRNAGNKSATVTISNATPAVITYTAHDLRSNAPVVFTTDGVLPSGLTAGTTYYLASTGVATANTFNVSATPGGAVIATTTAGSGTHTCTVGTYTEDSQSVHFLWNNDNQVYRVFYRVEATSSWTYTTATRRYANGNVLNRVDFLIREDSVIELVYNPRVGNSLTTTSINATLGLDDPTVISFGAIWTLNNQFAGTNTPVQGNCIFNNYVGASNNFLAATEVSTASGTTTWFGFSLKGGMLG